MTIEGMIPLRFGDKAARECKPRRELAIRGVFFLMKSPVGTNRTSSDVRSSVTIRGKRTWLGLPISVAIEADDRFPCAPY
jgi:hypothetical protein